MVAGLAVTMLLIPSRTPISSVPLWSPHFSPLVTIPSQRERGIRDTVVPTGASSTSSLPTAMSSPKLSMNVTLVLRANFPSALRFPVR